jgi:hypothetical protein
VLLILRCIRNLDIRIHAAVHVRLWDYAV